MRKPARTDPYSPYTCRRADVYHARMPFQLNRLLAPRPRRTQCDVMQLPLDDGSNIQIQRVRDPRARRIKLSVSERGARLTLPPQASLAAGERFVREQAQWLVEQLHAIGGDAVAPLVPGQSVQLPLRGQMLPLRWQTDRFARLEQDGQSLLFRLPAAAGAAAARRALRDFYEAQARADVARWLPRYLPGLPRTPSRIRIRPMSSQWGSLAPNGVLALDLALVLGRPEGFEYVLVHELCHLLHADHSPAFWHEVEARCPRWREQRDYFQKRGRLIKAQLHTLLS